MKKVINFAVFGAGGNQRGCSYSGGITTVSAINEPLDFIFIRKYLKDDWKQCLEDGTAATNEFRYYCTISIHAKSGTRYKVFKIDPKEIK